LLNVWAWVLIVTGAINIVANAIYCMFAGSFNVIQWVDKDGKMQSVTLHTGFLIMLGAAKIVFGVLAIK
jgi:hypothetical protein